MFFELFRYVIVGGIASVADLLTLTFFIEIVFRGDKSFLPLAIATASGFFVGLICNYLLSIAFVFVSPAQKEKNKQKGKTFGIFFLVGIVGLLLTEILMQLGMLIVSEEGFWYLLLSCFVKCVVLFWNYIGRKIFIYKDI